MTARGSSAVWGGCIAALVFARPARAQADEPVYVVTPDAVHVISEKELPVLRASYCKPKGKLSFDRAPPGYIQHCHGRFFLSGRVTSLASDPGAGAAWDRTTYAATGGVSLWAYGPRFARMLLEGEYGGGSGPDGAFTYEQLYGRAFAVPGVALRGGMSVVLRGAPEFWHSRWEVPALELPWVFADGLIAAELGARAALVAVGRFNLHDSSERLGGAILYGPYGVLSHRGTRLRTMVLAHLLRIERDPPFHELAARFCSGAGVFMVCAHADQRWMAVEQGLWNAARASGRATTLALSVGLTAP